MVTVSISYNSDLVQQAEVVGSELAYVCTYNGAYSVSGNEFISVRDGKTVIQNYMTRENMIRLRACALDLPAIEVMAVSSKTEGIFLEDRVGRST